MFSDGLALAALLAAWPLSGVMADDNGLSVLPWIKDPQAQDPQHRCPGYKASNVAFLPDGGLGGFTADLDLAGPACNVYGNDIGRLSLTVEQQADDRLHVEILPRDLDASNRTWFDLPEELAIKPKANGYVASPALNFTWTNEPSFSFAVTRRETGDVLFSTHGSKLVYEDQLLEFVVPLPANYNVYGLGEVIHDFRLGNNLTRTLFAADIGDGYDDNLYGHHPIYLETRYFDGEGKLVEDINVTAKAGPTKYSSFTHGVFLRNAHTQEVLLREEGITWRALGGSLDLYFYAGPTAAEVLKTYQTSSIGLPAMQQYFALGYHQSRWGYGNWTQLGEVIQTFKDFNIPLETIWLDLDYMYEKRDFTADNKTYSYEEGKEFLAKLHADGQHFVPLVDAAIYRPRPNDPTDAYDVYDRGVAANAFLKNPDDTEYIGQVWPGYTVFPDFAGSIFNGTGAIEWWIDELKNYHDKMAYDGIWIDMSEVSSFCTGSCGTGRLSENPVHPSFLLPGEPGNVDYTYPEGFEKTNATEAAAAASASSSQAAEVSKTAAPQPSTTSYYRSTPTPGVRNIDHPPYVINNAYGDLAVHAVSPNATHHGGLLEYDLHNLYGYQMLNATYHGLLKTFEGKRPFIIGRSTFAGAGRWSGHWGGDNASTWKYMASSIAHALSFSIFGIPMFGVDTCGFRGNADLELCSRWMQLSAFFPFYRNHNVLNSRFQEPYMWSAVAEASRTAMAIRYQLLPYMYTLFAEAHETGSTVMRALAWEFPEEPWLADADQQFLLGPALLITPCLEQGADTVTGYFPGVSDDSNTVWYDYYNQSAVAVASSHEAVVIDAPLGHIPVYVRGGHVLAHQEAALTTKAARQTPWSVLVALDKEGQASGSLYVDDGESLEPAEDEALWVRLEALGGTLTTANQGGAKLEETNPLANVTVLGVAQAPQCVRWNGADLETELWTYDETAKRLLVTGLEEKTAKGAWSEWTLEW